MLRQKTGDNVKVSKIVHIDLIRLETNYIHREINLAHDDEYLKVKVINHSHRGAVNELSIYYYCFHDLFLRCKRDSKQKLILTLPRTTHQ